MGIQRKKKISRPSSTNIPLLTSYVKRIKQEEEQKKLRSEYNIEQQDLLIVEKKNVIAQILRAIFQAFFSVLRVSATILIILLSTIGLASIIYPNIRAEIVITIASIIQEIRTYLNIH